LFPKLLERRKLLELRLNFGAKNVYFFDSCLNIDGLHKEPFSEN